MENTKDFIFLLVQRSMSYKRLEKDYFNWPNCSGTHIAINEQSLRWLLDGLTIQEKAHKPVMERQII